MKRSMVVISVLALSLILTACGKTEFSGAGDSLSLKSGELSQEDNGDAGGHLLQDIVDDPSLAELYSCGNNKVLICHVPPGNASAAHTLCISENAIPAHLEHAAETGEHDELGACEDVEKKKKNCDKKDGGSQDEEVTSSSHRRRL